MRKRNSTHTPLLQHPDTPQGHHQEELAHMPASTWESRQGRLSKAVRGSGGLSAALTNAVVKHH